MARPNYANQSGEGVVSFVSEFTSGDPRLDFVDQSIALLARR
jgi:hypothetical protein